MRQHKNWIKNLFSLTILFLFIIGLFNFNIDSLQFYRKTNLTPVFSDNERFQMPGFAKNYKYESIIMGTSMSQNTLTSDVDKLFNTKSINLSMSGATPKEQYKLIKIALKSNNVKHVFWNIDSFEYRSGKKNNKYEFPEYLYDKNPFNDLFYLLSIDTLKDSLSMVMQTNKNKQDWARLYYWGHKYKFDKSLVKIPTGESKKIFYEVHNVNNYQYNMLKKNIDEYIIKIINEYPNTNFYLYFPPYSMKYHKILWDIEPSIVLNWQKTKQYIFNQSKDYNNLKVFDFQDDYEVIYNLDNYKDLTHYSPKINKNIINQIQKNSDNFNKSNIDLRFNKFIKNISSYEL